MAYKLACGDILQFQVKTQWESDDWKFKSQFLFQEQLRQMRDVDDKVIYALNNSLPTSSIKSREDSNPETNCKELYERLKSSYVQRNDWIQGCIIVTADELSSLRKQREINDDIQLDKKFKSEQRKVTYFN